MKDRNIKLTIMIFVIIIFVALSVYVSKVAYFFGVSEKSIRLIIGLFFILLLYLVLQALKEFFLNLVDKGIDKITKVNVDDKEEYGEDEDEDKNEEEQKNMYSLPEPFGYKVEWLAVKSNDAQHVIDSLFWGRPYERTNWKKGIDAVHEYRKTYIAQPVEGWVLVAGADVLDYEKEGEARFGFLDSLIESFEEIQYFGSHRGSGYSAWARRGKLIEPRSFMVGDCELNVNHGSITKEEQELIDIEKPKAPPFTLEDNIEYDNFGDLYFIADEDGVLLLAEKWSINPIKIREYKEDNQEMGYLLV